MRKPWKLTRLPADGGAARLTFASLSAGLGTLLVLTLALAAGLAYEAYGAGRSRRATAEHALHDFAAFATWSLSYKTQAGLYVGLQTLFSPLGGGDNALAPERPPVGALAAEAARIVGCRCAPVFKADYYFRLDLRSGAVDATVPVSDAERAWLADTLRRTLAAGAGSTEAADFGVLFGRVDGRPRALAYSPYPYRGRAGEGRAATAVYGFASHPRAIGAAVFDDLKLSRAILPPNVGLDVSPDSVLAIAVLDPLGHDVFHGAAPFPDGQVTIVPEPMSHEGYRTSVDQLPVFVDSVELGPTLGGLWLRVAIRPEAAPRLIPGGLPRSRLPVLVGLLVLTAGLVAVAVLMLRREQELSRLRTDFTSSVSHELRTPLAQILLFAETLSLGRIRSSDERRGAAEVIVQEARRLMHLVDNILHFARSERRMQRLSLRAAPLAPLVRESLATFAPLAATAGVRLVDALEDERDEELWAMVDPAALSQIVLNLLDNAVKYGPAGGTVTVGAASAGDGRTVCLTIDDEGPGIPAPERDRIWQPFVRLARDRNGAVGGSGIGLAVVRELAELHGGRAWVEQAPGGGARFVVELDGGGRLESRDWRLEGTQSRASSLQSPVSGLAVADER